MTKIKSTNCAFIKCILKISKDYEPNPKKKQIEKVRNHFQPEHY